MTERLRLLGGQLVQRSSMPSEDEYEPTRNSDGMAVLDPPMRVEVDSRSVREQHLIGQCPARRAVQVSTIADGE